MATYIGTDGDDWLYGSSSADSIYGGGGNDRIQGNGGNDWLYGEAGDDFFSISQNTYAGELIRAFGGADKDRFYISLFGQGGGRVEADGGDGDDMMWLAHLNASTAVLTLGQGRDSIRIHEGFSTVGDSAIIVTDFEVGASGDRIDWDRWLHFSLTDWDRTSNPFAGGYMQVVQSGADTLLQIDRDAAGTAHGFVTLITFQNIAAGSLTAQNLGGFPSDGGAPVGLTLSGTEEKDEIRGSAAGDLIDGMDGNDQIFGALGDDNLLGGAGNDELRGEEGDDTLYGGAGNDTLLGQAGNDDMFGGDGDDMIQSFDGGTDEVYGEEGNDTISFSHGSSVVSTGSFISGGGGDDKISIQFYADGGTATFDAGDGADLVTIGYLDDTSISVTLGAGVDRLKLQSGISSATSVVIEDFNPGAGETIDWLSYLSEGFRAWDGASNPFANGMARLVQDGADVLLQVDEYGGESRPWPNYRTIITFKNVDVSAFTAATMGGYPPDGSVPAALNLTGTIGDDRLDGGVGADIIDGAGGKDTIFGSAGHDTLRGGEGDDTLNGELGDDLLEGGDGADVLNGGTGRDRLYGGEGDDRLAAGQSGATDHLYGEGGNDTLFLNYWGSVGSANNPDQRFASGGTGDDTIYVYAGAYSTIAIEGGDGADTVILQEVWASSATIALGAGRDTVRLDPFYRYSNADDVIVTDFVGGPDGDKVDWDGHLGTYLIGWDKVSNPFGLGYVRLLQSGSDTLVQMDRDAGGTRSAFVTLLILKNVSAGTLDASNFDGFDPHAPLQINGTDGPDTLTGTAGRDAVNGGNGSDVLLLYHGGDDTVLAGDGNDNIFFGSSLNAADLVDGGSGSDTLVVQGDYGAGLFLGPNVFNIENLSILAGSNTNFGEPGTNRYDYVLTIHDANFAAGVQARINGSALLAGEDFTFDGSAETDAKFVVYGGKGVDTLTGGLGNDIFFFAEERFASGDTVNGGAGYNGMFLRGNYTIDFNAPGYTGLFTNIHNLTLTSATDERYARGGATEFDYNLTLSDAIVKPGETLTISGTILMASETMIVDASQETDGLLRLFGGKANDTLKGAANADLIHGNLGADSLTGNGGADTFRFDSTSESNSATMDEILDFTPGTDKIDLSRIDANSLVAGDQAFSWIGSNTFSGTAGQLRAYQEGSNWFVEGDTNGDGFADLVIELTLQGPTLLGAGDFLL